MARSSRNVAHVVLRACGPAALAVTAAAMGSAKAGAAVNLLADPGFEVSQGNVDASAAGDQNAATGWTVFGSGYTTAAIAHTGTQSFKTFGQYNGGFQQITVTPGQSYTASVYAINSSNDPLGNGTQGELELNFFTDASADFGTFQPHATEVVTGGVTPLDQWTLGSVTATVPTGYTVARIQLNPNTTYNGGAVFWDDASLTLNAASVPEPASLGLLAAVAVPALAARRRRAAR